MDFCSKYIRNWENLWKFNDFSITKWSKVFRICQTFCIRVFSRIELIFHTFNAQIFRQKYFWSRFVRKNHLENRHTYIFRQKSKISRQKHLTAAEWHQISQTYRQISQTHRQACLTVFNSVNVKRSRMLHRGWAHLGDKHDFLGQILVVLLTKNGPQIFGNVGKKFPLARKSCEKGWRIFWKNL